MFQEGHSLHLVSCDWLSWRVGFLPLVIIDIEVDVDAFTSVKIL